jgi:hypothetical protein
MGRVSSDCRAETPERTSATAAHLPCRDAFHNACYDQLVVIRVMTTVAISQARLIDGGDGLGTVATAAFHNQRLAKKASKGASALKRRADCPSGVSFCRAFSLSARSASMYW